MKTNFVVDDTPFPNNNTSTTKFLNTFKSKAEYIENFKRNKFHADSLDAKLQMEYVQENDNRFKNNINYQLKKKTLESMVEEQLVEKEAVGHKMTDFMKLGDILKKYDPTLQAKSIDEFENKIIYITCLKETSKNFSKDPNKEDIGHGYRIEGYDENGNDISIITFVFQVRKTCELLLSNIKHTDGKFNSPIQCKVESEFRKRPNKYNDWYKTFKLVEV